MSNCLCMPSPQLIYRCLFLLLLFLMCVFQRENIWGPFLIISPASTLNNWHQEFARFVPKFKVISTCKKVLSVFSKSNCSVLLSSLPNYLGIWNSVMGLILIFFFSHHPVFSGAFNYLGLKNCSYLNHETFILHQLKDTFSVKNWSGARSGCSALIWGPGSRYKNNISVLYAVFRVRAVFSVP